MKRVLLFATLLLGSAAKSQCVVILRNDDTSRAMNISIPNLGIFCALRAKCMSKAYKVDSTQLAGGYVIVDTSGDKSSRVIDTASNKLWGAVHGFVKSGKYTFSYFYNPRKKTWGQGTRHYDAGIDGSIDYENQRDLVWKMVDTRMGPRKALMPSEYPTAVSDSITRSVIFQQLHP